MGRVAEHLVSISGILLPVVSGQSSMGDSSPPSSVVPPSSAAGRAAYSPRPLFLRSSLSSWRKLVSHISLNGRREEHPTGQLLCLSDPVSLLGILLSFPWIPVSRSSICHVATARSRARGAWARVWATRFHSTCVRVGRTRTRESDSVSRFLELELESAHAKFCLVAPKSKSHFSGSGIFLPSNFRTDTRLWVLDKICFSHAGVGVTNFRKRLVPSCGTVSTSFSQMSTRN